MPSGDGNLVGSTFFSALQVYPGSGDLRVSFSGMRMVVFVFPLLPTVIWNEEIEFLGS